MKGFNKSVFCFIILLLTLTGTAGAPLSAKMYVDERDYGRAVITRMEKIDVPGRQGIVSHNTRIHLDILDGRHKGKKMFATFSGDSDLPRDLSYNTGDTVFIGVSRNGLEGTTEHVSIYDQDNTTSIIILVTLMVAVIFYIGRLKGLASLGALIITVVLIFFVLIPWTLKGYPPLPVSIAISIFSIAITMPIIMGFRLKTIGAILGASGGVILSAVLALFFGAVMHLSGIVTNDMLQIFFASDVPIDLRGLVLSGMIISALGALMDVAISIASSTAEIFAVNPAIESRDAYRSVITIGRDILGSMVNTLVLAYVGSSLALVLWIAMRISPDVPVWMVLNHNPILSEIVKSAIGSIGMFFAIPLTARISVFLYGRRRKG